MEQLNLIIDTYQRIVLESESQLVKAKRYIYRIGTLQLMPFVTEVTGIIYFWSGSRLVIDGIAAIISISFLLLVRSHNRLFRQKNYLEERMEINRQELQATTHDTSAFDNRKEFIDPAHLYTYDLDAFDKYSLLQYINRIATQPGKEGLAEWVNTHLKNKVEIEKRKEAVKELAPELEMRQHFRILGLLYKGKMTDEGEIGSWAASPEYYRKKWYFRTLAIFAPSASAVCFGLAIAGVILFTTWGIVFAGIGPLSSSFPKGVSQIQSVHGKKTRILTTHVHLIHVIGGKEMESSALERVKGLVGGGKQTASQAVERFIVLMNAPDRRNNMLMQFILNGFFFWGLRQVMEIETWRESLIVDLPHWLGATGETDVYCSLTTFVYNHPGYVFSEIASKPFCMEAEALGHPLMGRDKYARNDIQIAK